MWFLVFDKATWVRFSFIIVGVGPISQLELTRGVAGHEGSAHRGGGGSRGRGRGGAACRGRGGPSLPRRRPRGRSHTPSFCSSRVV
eukprot:2235730-Rhodomonas_salina.1